MPIEFSEFQFGYKSAEAERRYNPALLLEGFFDKKKVIAELVNGSSYLVLGYKGSGKSSIAEHLSLLAKENPELFVTQALLRDFPFDDVPNVVSESGDVAIRMNLGWSILLLLKLFESLTTDNGVSDTEGDMNLLSKELRELNLLPKRKLRDLVLTSKELNLSVSLSKAFSTSLKHTYSEPILVLSQVRDRLKQIIINAVTSSRHILVIDGLDEVFTRFTRTYESLAALIHEVDSLNAEFEDTNSCTKIVLLCRTDIFERLPSPNINKLRDFAKTLDWYHNPTRPLRSELFALATHRARLSNYAGENVLLDYLPTELRRGTGGRVQTFKFLLDHTRHTPRDFVQLIYYVQKEVHHAQVGSDDVFDGLRQYSIEYFLPELKDELAGYFTPDEVEDCIRLIGGLRRREFTVNDLEKYASVARVGAIDLPEALKVLFDCSAIGNIVNRPRVGSRAGTFYTFRFRNRNASINYDETLILHRGAWKALNLT